MKLEFSWHSFEKYSNAKFDKNPSSGSWFVKLVHVDRWTDTEKTKLIVACRNFADVPKICKVTWSILTKWLLGMVYILKAYMKQCVAFSVNGFVEGSIQML
jgi:hypothetical protein